MADGSQETVRRGVDRVKVAEPPLSDRPITPDRYWDRGFWSREWDKVWTRTWQVAGTVAQVRNAGDFLTTTFGPETILCVRGDDGVVRAFYNVCQHRGMLLTTEEQGSSRRLVCPYHGWVYDLKGVLRSVPDADDFPQGNPCGKKNLVEIPCETWTGFVWFNMDPGCMSLATYMAPIAEQVDTYPMDEMVRTHWVTLDADFNWKLVQDNFNESYHLPFVHPQTKYVMEQSYRFSQFDLYPTGHCRMLMPGATPTRSMRGGEEQTLSFMGEELRFWGLNPEDYHGRTHAIRADIQQQKRRLGAEKGYDFSKFSDEQLTDHYHYTIFPSLSFSLKPDGNIFLRARPHATDPEKCLFDMWYMTWFPKGVERYYAASVSEWVSVDTPASHAFGKEGEVTTGPGIDQDLSVWAVQQRGLRSRGYQRDYLAGQERRVRYFHETLDRWMAAD